MNFGLLGPLTVVDQDLDRTPSAPKPRQMLALLLVNANHVVSIAQFVDELWELTPPSTAVAAVHTYVMHLRRALRDPSPQGGGSTHRLITRSQGYQFDVRPGELDLDVFRTRVHAGRNAFAQGEFEPAAAHLHAALGMWRAQFLVDVTAGPLLRATIASIERTRLAAVTQRVEADLRLGRHHELIGELSGLVHQHPTDEDFAAQLMLALYRSGRQTDALTAFHRLRQVLADELGTVPSHRMHAFYRDILTAHPRLDVPAGTRTQLSLDLASPCVGPSVP